MNTSNESLKELLTRLLVEGAGQNQAKDVQPPAHHPGTPPEEIKDTGEKAFQRAIMNGGISYLSTDKKDRVRWIDFEVPVGDSDTPRDNCVDLIGKDATGRYVLCELKFSGKSTGNGGPQEAADQLKNYAAQLAENVESIRFHENAKEAFNPMRYVAHPPRLMVAADLVYWGKRIKEPRDQSLENYLVVIGGDEFVKQKGENVQYKPEMPPSGFMWRRLKK